MSGVATRLLEVLKQDVRAQLVLSFLAAVVLLAIGIPLFVFFSKKKKMNDFLAEGTLSLEQLRERGNGL